MFSLHQGAVQSYGAPHLGPLEASSSPSHAESSAASNPLPAMAFKIHAKSQKKFWVRVLVRPQATLAVLDVFLRDLWMEPCCNHLSTFEVGNKTFSDQESVVEGMGDADMGSVRLMDCLSVGLKFKYIYDMGNSTYVDLKVEDEVAHPGHLFYHTQWARDPYMQALSNTDPGAMIRVQPLPLKVAGRNRWPKNFVCSHCGARATKFCPACLDTYWQDFGDQMAFCCDACIEHHATHERELCCSEDGAEEPELVCEDAGKGLRPVVNSPRMGECGYMR